MPNVGSAYVTLMPSMRGFAGEVDKEFRSAGASAGDAFSTGIGNASEKTGGFLSGLGSIAATAGKAAVAGFTALTGAVTAAGAAAIGSYADCEQLVGGVDTLFGDASAKVQQYAADAFKTAGMSANQYMTQATSFAASLVQSVGGDTAKAAEYANMAMVDMSDNVNKMGSSMTDVQNAYQGFAKQNYTMLDNLKLGYGGTKSEMERLIADANKLREAQGKTADLTISSYADVVEAIHTVQDEMGITGTTAQEAATTISGSVGMAKGAWENFLAGLGRDDVDFSALTDNLLSSIGAVATNVAPRVSQIGAGIVAAFPVALSGLGEVLAPVVSEALSAAWNIAADALSGIGIKLPDVDASQIMSAFGEASALIGQVGTSLQTFFGSLGETFAPVIDGLTTIAGAAAGFVASFVESGGLDTALNTLSGLVGFLVQISPLLAGAAAAYGVFALAQGAATAATIAHEAATKAVAVAQGILNAVMNANPMMLIVTVIAAVVAALMTLWTTNEGFREAVTNAWNSIVSTLSGVWATVCSTVSGAVEAVRGAIQTALDAISSTWNSVWSGITGFFSGIWDGLQSAASSGIDAVYNTVTGIKDSITGFFSGAGQWLVDSGRAILDGLRDGIMGAIGSVKDAVSGALSSVRNLFPFSPAKEGPFSGHGYTTYSGRALMRDMGKGITSGEGLVTGAVTSALAAAQRAASAGLTIAPTVAGYGAPTASGMLSGGARSVAQTFVFNQPVKSPDEVARLMRMQERYGLAAEV